jgi:hypothetical protein
MCLHSACNLRTPLDSISQPLLDGLVRCHFVLLGQVDLRGQVINPAYAVARWHHWKQHSVRLEYLSYDSY